MVVPVCRQGGGAPMYFANSIPSKWNLALRWHLALAVSHFQIDQYSIQWTIGTSHQPNLTIDWINSHLPQRFFELGDILKNPSCPLCLSLSVFSLSLFGGACVDVFWSLLRRIGEQGPMEQSTLLCSFYHWKFLDDCKHSEESGSWYVDWLEVRCPNSNWSPCWN